MHFYFIFTIVYDLSFIFLFIIMINEVKRQKVAIKQSVLVKKDGACMNMCVLCVYVRVSCV